MMIIRRRAWRQTVERRDIKPRYYRASQMKQTTLFDIDTPKSVFDSHRSYGIERWRKEKLFQRCRDVRVPDIPEGRKIKWINQTRGRIYDVKRDGVRGAGVRIAKQQIITQKKVAAKKMFRVITDVNMRDIMAEMILRSELLSARYICKKMGASWPQFVADFNFWLQMVIANDEQQRAR